MDEDINKYNKISLIKFLKNLNNSQITNKYMTVPKINKRYLLFKEIK